MPLPNIDDRDRSLEIRCACHDITSIANFYVTDDEHEFLNIGIYGHGSRLTDYLRRWWYGKNWEEMSITKDDAVHLRDRLDGWIEHLNNQTKP